MKVAALIITFNPEINALKKNINAIKKQISQVVIVDNNSKNIDEIKELFSDIYFILENSNVGIAKATNDGFKLLKSKKIEWVLTMDQDSVIPMNLMKEYSKHIDDKIGLLATIQKPVNEMKVNGKKINVTEDGILVYSNNIEKSRKIIASGSLVNVSAWKSVGGFDETLFIDAVDFDFNMKLLLHNFFVEQLDIVMSHKLGNPVMKSFFGKNIYSFNHVPMRKYYIARNSIIMAKRYNNLKQEKKLLLKYFIKIILVENNKCKKIIAFFHGIMDGFKYNKGSL